jgi:hypothetical protein
VVSLVNAGMLSAGWMWLTQMVLPLIEKALAQIS